MAGKLDYRLPPFDCQAVAVAPLFFSSKPPEYDSKDKLYRMICPACGCEECRKLLDEERFTITGSKGNLYTMQYACLNPDCQYYW